jgi:hypothetical protein
MMDKHRIDANKIHRTLASCSTATVSNWIEAVARAPLSFQARVRPAPTESVPRPSDSLRKRAGLTVSFSSTPESGSRPVW